MFEEVTGASLTPGLSAVECPFLQRESDKEEVFMLSSLSTSHQGSSLQYY